MRPSGEAGFLSSSSSSGSTRWWISLVAFQTRNRPPASNSRSRTENARPSTVPSGSVKCTRYDAEASSARRNTSASDRPSLRAKPRRRSSMRFVSSAMNTRLSRPSTTSIAIRVASAAHASGSSARRRSSSMRRSALSPQASTPRRSGAPQSRAPQRVSKLGPRIAGLSTNTQAGLTGLRSAAPWPRWR